jgi:hypothetical protein
MSISTISCDLSAFLWQSLTSEALPLDQRHLAPQYPIPAYTDQRHGFINIVISLEVEKLDEKTVRLDPHPCAWCFCATFSRTCLLNAPSHTPERNPESAKNLSLLRDMR